MLLLKAGIWVMALIIIWRMIKYLTPPEITPISRAALDAINEERGKGWS